VAGADESTVWHYGRAAIGWPLLREGINMRFGFIARHRSVWPVGRLCQALGVSRTGFYAWLKRGPYTSKLFQRLMADDSGSSRPRPINYSR
jgi:hypothetical protein